MKKLIILMVLLGTAAVAWAALEDDMDNLGVDSWWLANVDKTKAVSMLRDYEDVTAANTIAYTECGTTYFLNSATEFETTLPTPQAGCYFKFIVKAAPSGAAYTIVTASSANILIGGINELETDDTEDGPSDADADTITFADGVSVVGDYVEMTSDGTSWYFTGQAVADGGVVPSKAS